jgi:hypothetical protein
VEVLASVGQELGRPLLHCGSVELGRLQLKCDCDLMRT